MRCCPSFVLPLLLMVGSPLLGCGDDGESGTADAGVDGTPAPDLTPDSGPILDGPARMAVGEVLELETDPSGMIQASTPTTGSEKYLLLLYSLNTTPLKAPRMSTTRLDTSG